MKIAQKIEFTADLISLTFLLKIMPIYFVRSRARNYKPQFFRENKPKTLVLYDWKWPFWTCFLENWVYKFGHWNPLK
jgi:hypothetical protein